MFCLWLKRSVPCGLAEVSVGVTPWGAVVFAAADAVAAARLCCCLLWLVPQLLHTCPCNASVTEEATW
jgi:hypothetical protein